jgi:hypothetical protein
LLQAGFIEEAQYPIWLANIYSAGKEAQWPIEDVGGFYGFEQGISER